MQCFYFSKNTCRSGELLQIGNWKPQVFLSFSYPKKKAFSLKKTKKNKTYRFIWSCIFICKFPQTCQLDFEVDDLSKSRPQSGCESREYWCRRGDGDCDGGGSPNKWYECWQGVPVSCQLCLYFCNYQTLSEPSHQP